ASDHRPNHPWCGDRPRPTRSVTVMPSGAVGDCGSTPSFTATSRLGSVWMLLPSRYAAPDVGRSSRAMPRSNVDLPHALGPTTTVNPPEGTLTDNPSTTVRSP